MHSPLPCPAHVILLNLITLTMFSASVQAPHCAVTSFLFKCKFCSLE
jgi:hypothetical protein